MIDTGSQSIRVPAYYTYAGPNGGEPNFYSTDELADRVNELIYHEEVTQFNTGFDNGTQTPFSAFTEEFFAHPGTRIVINGVATGAVIALAVYTGGGSLAFTGVTGISSIGLVDATAYAGVAWATFNGWDQILSAAGEWTGELDRGERSYGTQLGDRFTEDPDLTDDIAIAANLSFTIVELGAGAYLFFKGTRAPSNILAIKPANIATSTQNVLRFLDNVPPGTPGRTLFGEVRDFLAHADDLTALQKADLFEEAASRINQIDPSWMADRHSPTNAAALFSGDARPFGLVIDNDGVLWQTDNFIEGTNVLSGDPLEILFNCGRWERVR